MHYLIQLFHRSLKQTLGSNCFTLSTFPILLGNQGDCTKIIMTIELGNFRCGKN